LLANHILQSKTAENNKQFTEFSADVKYTFLQYDLPGNIRELQNVIENIVVIYDGQTVQPNMLPSNFGHSIVSHSVNNHSVQSSQTTTNNTAKSSTHTIASQQPSPHNIVQLWIVEKNAIEAAIGQCDGNIPLAAAYLGISASTIYRKMKSWTES